MLTADQIAQKWRERSAASGRAITIAVQQMAEEENPCRKAAAKQTEWMEGVRRAGEANKFRDSLNQVSMAEWRQAMIDKGVPNYQNGLARGQQKLLAVLPALLAHIQSGKRQLASTPRGTLEQNLARSANFIRHMATFRATRAGAAVLGIGLGLGG